MRLVSLLIVASLATLGVADLYCHNPRASNNRLNEKSANRDNGDRLFDSQNNNRGGYNVGEHGVTAFSGNNPYLDLTAMLNDATTTNAQYSMVYYEGSILPLEWTNQHGCGGNGNSDQNKLNCNMVVQYTCETTPTAWPVGARVDYAMRVYLKDGGNTNTPDEPNSFSDVSTGATAASNDNNQRGRHESEGWYFECKTRRRNTGLFTADQNLNNQDARSTRQNPNGNRRGLECPEERDYYPYWTPDPWIDIAYLTDRLDLCPMIAANSMNTNSRQKCVQTNGYDQAAIVRALTQTECANAGGTWMSFTHGLNAARNTIKCEATEWTRDNHLGNTRFGQPWMWNWTLPLVSDLTGAGKIQSFSVTGDTSSSYVKCVFRLRYNLTTDDYDPWNTTSSSNQGNNNQNSPVTQNPTVDVGAQDLQGLALAINTNQFGRTFQDRSHVFYIKSRPTSGVQDVNTENSNDFSNPATKIFNLNVRGKRGNIVQTYPAVEYDFVPNIMTVTTSDYIHFQWTGSNTHNNGDPGGDGQTGDAGEGTGGTDRHGWAESGDSASNYPLPLDHYQAESLILGTPARNSDCYDIFGRNLELKYPASGGVNCALTLATSGQIRQVSAATTDFDPLLNDAPASLIGGVLLRPRVGAVATSPHNYIDTRNNNFSNRSTKGSITVCVGLPC